MKILVTACNGQLGVDAVSYFSKKHEVIPFRDVELDITDEAKVIETVKSVKPDVVLNCAAFTNVNACETKSELAFRVNAYGAGVVAKAAEEASAAIVHISTDYVFDGTKSTPYTEADITGPTNAYGRSKLEGEKQVLKLCSRHYILRTAWLYGPHGEVNFVKTMLRLGGEKGKVSVVTDQIGNPTSTFELIRMIECVLEHGKYGVYNVTCEGSVSWNGFAREIFSTAGMDVEVEDVTSERFPSPAKRPAFSMLSKEKLFRDCGYRPADWKSALWEYFDYTKGKVDF